MVALLLSLLGLLVPETVLAPAPAPASAGQPTVESLRLAEWQAARRPVRPVARTEITQAARQSASFHTALDTALALSGAAGTTFAVVRDGTLIWTGAAGSNLSGGAPLTADSPMVIGSVTKTFVAALILQLADERLLSLDDTLARHLPDLAALGLGGAEAITVRQLLDHTSGLADVFNDTTRQALEEQPQRGWSRPEVLATLHDAWYRPGEGWAYANTNYLLLSMIAERVTGRPLHELLEQRFLVPLRLNGTRALLPEDADGSPLAAGWATIFWGSGAMASTAADLARWGDALYTGRLLTPRATLDMLDFNGHDYGLGVQRHEFAGYTGYGHTGLLNGYTSFLLHLPADRVTVALLVNRSRADLEGMLTQRADGHRSLLRLALGGYARPGTGTSGAPGSAD